MRSYNICVLRDRVEENFNEQLDIYRSLSRIGGHKISQINYRGLYDLHGPKIALKKIRDEIKKNDPEIVVFAQGYEYDFPIEFFSELRRERFMVLRVGDDEHYFDKHHRYYSQGFDLVWASSIPNKMRYELYGVDAISSPPSYDLRNNKRLSCEKVNDVCFVGDVRGKIGREKYLKYLVDNKVNVAVFGEGTPGGAVSRDEMNRIFASSKIGLNFTGLSIRSSLDKDITVNRRIKQIKGRSHEIALTGSFVLSEYAPGIEDDFEVGNEIDVFYCEKELLSKTRYYLENNAIREEMALKAYKRVVHDCDEVKVSTKVMSVIDAKIELKNRSPDISDFRIYKDPIFKRAFSSFHLSKMFEFLPRGMPRAALQEFAICMKYPFFDGGVFLWLVKIFIVRNLADIKWLRAFVRKMKNILGSPDSV